MTHSPQFDIDMALICADAARGWTSLEQCRSACRALVTLEGLDALRKRLSELRDGQNVSLLTAERMKVIRGRMDEIQRGMP
jgi:hypothetical protein